MNKYMKRIAEKLDINKPVTTYAAGHSFSIITDAVCHIESKHGGKNKKSKHHEGIKLINYKKLIQTLKTASSGAKQVILVRKPNRRT